jgi:hypothetical protein
MWVSFEALFAKDDQNWNYQTQRFFTTQSLEHTLSAIISWSKNVCHNCFFLRLFFFSYTTYDLVNSTTPDCTTISPITMIQYLMAQFLWAAHQTILHPNGDVDLVLLWWRQQTVDVSVNCSATWKHSRTSRLLTTCNKNMRIVRFRKVALVVLLTRAGLDLDPEALKKLYLRVITLGIVPWLAEAILMAVCSHFFLGLPLMWAMLLGFVSRKPNI